MDSKLLGVILLFNVVIWIITYIATMDIWETFKMATLWSIFITLLCIASYLITGGV